jgi:hypothetical protein
VTCDRVTNGKTLENYLKSIRSISSNRSTVSFFKTAQKPFINCVGKCSCDRIRYKIYLNSDANFVRQPLITVQGAPLSATD